MQITSYHTLSAIFLNRVAVLLIPCLLAACAMPGFMRSESPAPTSSMDTFRVLTYNTLHGLEVHRFWVSQVESPEMLAERYKLRIEQLVNMQPDIILLQEVNPLPQMAKDYVLVLKQQGLDYAEVHQVDACGVRLAPGVALLPGLNNGLVILAKAPLEIKKLNGVKLSGTIGRCGDNFGVQFGELRYALLAEVANPRTNMKYLVATAHLHSGIERDSEFLHQLMEAHKQGRLHQYEQLMKELVQDEKRRLQELHTLMDALHEYEANSQYDGVVIGGDFNFEPGSPEYRELSRLGLEDTHELAMPEDMLSTYNPQMNPLAVYEEDKLPPAFTQAIAGESPNDQQEIEVKYRESIRMARRIDFLFSMAFMPRACVMQALFGEPNMAGQASSDHYGVLNTYSYQRMPC